MNCLTKYICTGVLFMFFAQAAYAAEVENEGVEDSSNIITDEGRWDKSTRLVQKTLFHFEDLKNIVKYPYEHSEEAWYYLAGLGALILIDKPVTKFYQDKFEPIFEGHVIPPPKFLKGNKWASNGPDTYMILGMAGSYVVGVGLNNEKMQESALLASKATLYSFLISHVVLKSVTARKRPIPNLSSGNGVDRDFTTNPFDFGFYHTPSFTSSAYGTALPSFHFTQFFAMAKLYQKMYDNYWIPYTLMTIGLTSSITAHRHWVSDMVAGAVIGTLIGSVVADGAGQNETADTVILPEITSEEVGVRFTHKF